MRVVAHAADLEQVLGGGDRLRGHLVPGQGAGLVGADDGDRAERLHRRQPPDDGVPPRHALDADGERDREDRRQALRDGGDRKADRGQEHLAEAVALDQDPEREGQRRQREDRAREPAREARHLAKQRRGQGLDLRQQTADASDLGGRPRGDDDAGALTVGHEGSGVGHRGTVAEGSLDRRPAPFASRPAATRP